MFLFLLYVALWVHYILQIFLPMASSQALCFMILLLISTCTFGIRWQEYFDLTPRLLESVKEKQFNFTQQKLDHFNPEDSRVFSQQYFEILDFFTPKGPIFLVICGEWDCFGNYEDFPVELARTLGAAIVTVEHRYYGESSPFQELTIDNLKYLTSKQALFDLAVFRQYYQDLINRNYNKEGDNPWFSIGGSYPGALSAWFRLKFPHLVRGSLASSAVVNAIVNYSAYDEQIGISVGPVCASALRDLTSLAETSLKENATAVKSLFSAQELLDDDFLKFLADTVAGPVQFARQSLVCKPLLEAKKSNSNLLVAYANYTSSRGFDTGQWERQRVKAGIQAGPDSSHRNWMYQYCTEFGFFQIAASNNSIRSARLNSEFYLELCDFFFGKGTTPQAEMTNLYYGGFNISGTKILFMNGSQDPWRHASRQLFSVDEPSFIVTCETCSHIVDLRGCSTPEGGVSTQCKEQLDKARKLVTSYATKWLAD